MVKDTGNIIYSAQPYTTLSCRRTNVAIIQTSKSLSSMPKYETRDVVHVSMQCYPKNMKDCIMAFL